MTTEHEASRTLVKSPPELWAECSDPGSLARHLGEFGEITITRLEPENAVAWEGEHASGTVRIEPAGWGTRVTLTAHTRAEVAEPEPEPEEPGEVEAAAEVEPEGEALDDATLEETETSRGRARWRRISARVRRAFTGVEPDPVAEDPAEPEPEPAPEPVPEAAAEPEPEPSEPPMPEVDAEAILTSALDSLGQAHHRPFSRA